MTNIIGFYNEEIKNVFLSLSVIIIGFCIEIINP